MLVDKEEMGARLSLDGLHHVTALTAHPAGCIAFYGGLLGLSCLDPSLAYEPTGGGSVAFGDRLASPGAMLSFLTVAGGRRGRAGAGTVARIGWRVADVEALGFWQDRLRRASTSSQRKLGPGADSLPTLRFRDPEGLEHELRIDASDDEPLLGFSPEVPERFAFRGLDGVDVHSRNRVASADLLAGRLDFAADGRDGFRVVGPTRRAHYRQEDAPATRAVPGAGTVDHVAWSCQCGDEQVWRQRVIGLGARVTPVADREYFRSLHFREPSGVVFEIATRGPATSSGPPLVRA